MARSESCFVFLEWPYPRGHWHKAHGACWLGHVSRETGVGANGSLREAWPDMSPKGTWWHTESTRSSQETSPQRKRWASTGLIQSHRNPGAHFPPCVWDLKLWLSWARPKNNHQACTARDWMGEVCPRFSACHSSGSHLGSGQFVSQGTRKGQGKPGSARGQLAGSSLWDTNSRLVHPKPGNPGRGYQGT